jgi:cyclic di-GMP phosphodiesterase Gmr
LVLHFQPRLLLSTLTLRGVEVLVRWRSPDRGLVSPLDFVEAAERDGHIRDLEAWVVREALLQSRVWRDDGLDFGVSVNLSLPDLHDPSFLRLVMHTLRIQGNPHAFIVEVAAEGAAIDPHPPFAAFEDFRQRGIRTALDNVTSTEQLAAMRAVRWNYVKLGRSLIRSAAHDQNAAALARRLAEAARSDGARVAAVGVEDQAGLDLAREIGAHLVQGYLFAAPMPTRDLVEWIRARG